MDLLNSSQIATIRAALRNVADTFNKKPVTYKLFNTISSDPWQEDQANAGFTTYNLVAFYEDDVNTAQELVETAPGKYSIAQVTITFNREYLEEQGLVDMTTFKNIFSEEKDYFIVDGIEYKTVRVTEDGLIDGKQILVVIKGQINNYYTR